MNSCGVKKSSLLAEKKTDTINTLKNLLKTEVARDQYLTLELIKLQQQFAEHLKNDSIIANNTGNSSYLESVLPTFPNPPPQPSARYIFNSSRIKNAKSYGDINDIVVNCLNHGGYQDKYNYFLFDEGFAIATDMEQINDDASPKPNNERWLQGSVNKFKETWSLRSYISKLFVSQPGYYRTIVFIISNSLNTFSPNDFNKELFSKYISQGAIDLPPGIKSKSLEKNITVTALIYEFKKSENSLNALLITDAIGGFEQLKRSSIVW